MKTNQIFCCFAFFVLFCSFVFTGDARAQSYWFRSYQVEDGLSHNSVFSIVQDQRGFMWFGTKDGLNRFDGYSFKIFRKDASNPGSIGNNFILSLIVDKRGVLWVGTQNGLYHYSAESESFSLVKGSEELEIVETCFDTKENLWFRTGAGVGRYSIGQRKLVLFRERIAHIIFGICAMPNGDVWASTRTGELKKYIPEKNRFVHYRILPAGYSGIKWLGPLMPIDSSSILISGRSSSEILIFNSKTKSSRNISLGPVKQNNVFLRNIMKNTADEFWISSESGIFIYNHKTGQASNIKKQLLAPATINDNAVYPMYKDREGGIWIGTYFGGLNYRPAQNSPFENFVPNTSKVSLHGNVVREIKKDRYGKIWVGTEDGGLNKFDPSTGEFEHFLAGPSKTSISSNNIHGLLASGNELWVGTFFNGLDVLDITTGKVIRKYKTETGSGLSTNFIYYIYETADGQKLVGTNSGILRYKPEKDHFEALKPFPEVQWYSFIGQDSQKTLYACTLGAGIYYYNKDSKTYGNIKNVPTDSNSLSNDRVNSFFEDSDKNLWFATEDGLSKWNRSKNKWSRYGMKQGFPSNFMLSILEDKRKLLWVSTTKGLVRFDPKTLIVKTFTRSDGYLGGQLNYNSALKTSENRFYVGSLKGLIAFDPLSFRKSTFMPPIYLTDLNVDNKQVVIGEKNGILEKSIILTRSVTLDHEQSSLFSLEFSALGYTSPESQIYAFKLEGLSKKWTFPGKNRKVYFNKVPAGEYTFKVKASDGSGNWGPESEVLKLKILPPFWLSPLAYILYFIVAFGVIFLSFRIYHTQMELKNRGKIALMELAKEKEVIEAKIDFFTNVAHEIRTPLTLIKIPLRTIARITADQPTVSSSLKIINNNTDRLIELSNQLLDFREAEISDFKLDLKKCDLSELVSQAFKSFQPLAHQNKVKFSLHMKAQPLYAMTDVDSLNKILFNLFSNAIKYAHNHASIELKTASTIHGEKAVIEVKNNGDTIAEEFREKIFEPFFRVKKSSTVKGTGIGLSLARSLTALLGGELRYLVDEDSNNTFLLSFSLEAEDISPS